MDSFSLADISDSFATELQDSAHHIGTALADIRSSQPLSLEESLPNLQAAAQRMSLQAHTINGTSALVGLQGVAEESHCIETLAEDLVQACVTIQRCLVAFYDPDHVVNRYSDLVEKAIPLVQAGDAAAVDQLFVPEEEEGANFQFVATDSLAKDSAPATSEFTFTPSVDPELVAIFKEEYEAVRSQLLAALTDDDEGLDLSEARRLFHLLKGAAGSVGLDQLSRNFASGETVLEQETCSATDFELLHTLISDCDVVVGIAPQPELSEDMQAVFFTEVRQALQDVWAQQQRAGWSSTFHRLYGSALVVGEEQIAAIAKELSNWFTDHDQEPLQLIYDQLNALADLVGLTPPESMAELSEPLVATDTATEDSRVTTNPMLWSVFSVDQ